MPLGGPCPPNGHYLICSGFAWVQQHHMMNDRSRNQTTPFFILGHWGWLNLHTLTLCQLSTCCNWYLSVFEGVRVRSFPELENGEIMHLELLEVQLGAGIKRECNEVHKPQSVISVGNVFVTESVSVLTLDHWWYDVEYILPATFPSLWTECNQLLNSADLRMRAICSWVHRFVLCRFESCSSFRFEDIWSYPLMLALECHWPHCLHVRLSIYLSDFHFCSLILWSSTLCWACTDDYRFTAPFTYLYLERHLKQSQCATHSTDYWI